MISGRGAHPSPETLVAYQEGRLEPQAAAKVRRHLDQCEGCAQEVEAARAWDQAAAEVAKKITIKGKEKGR